MMTITNKTRSNLLSWADPHLVSWIFSHFRVVSTIDDQKGDLRWYIKRNCDTSRTKASFIKVSRSSRLKAFTKIRK